MARKRQQVALYVRVSTDEQDLEHQEHDLRELLERRGWELAQVPTRAPVRPGDKPPVAPAVFREKVSGVARRRPELERLRECVARRSVDAVLVWSISRLGRTSLEVLRLAEEFFECDVGLLSFREPAVDTTTAMGRMVLQVGAAFAEFERAELIARTRSGIEGARRRGVQLGRPRHRASPGQVAYALSLEGATAGAVARNLGVSARTVRRRAAEARQAAAAAKKGGDAGATPSDENPAG